MATLAAAGWLGAAPSQAVAPSRFLVVGGTGSSNVAVLGVDSHCGLSTVAGSPFPSGTGALSVAVTPDGRNVYVAQTVSGALSGYRLGAGGGLTPNGVQLDFGEPVVGIVVTPDGSRLFATVGGLTNEIRSYTITSDGSLAPTGAAPLRIPGLSALTMPVFSPDGRFLFLASYVQGQVFSYAVGADSSLTLVGDAQPGGGMPTLPAVTPDGRFLYVSNETTGDLSGFAIGPDGSLTPTPGSRYRTALEPHGAQITPDSKRLYLPAAGGGVIDGFAIAADGALTPLPGSPYAAAGGALVGRVILDPEANCAFVIDALTVHGTSQVHTYALAADGSMAPTGGPIDIGVVFSDGPSGVLTEPR
ncbi:lactonase family protein [Nocardia sp. alder85J]|uniref:lactonase family protein n=1 Tax=Nocardia sp. alder85J TaxID=2862949 RepID=UPI001CD5369E|nr:beta-propeller fold lactonase family protein [Nocardia sp. alder85J]MCX4095556.1 beta-propeller fold lactonase family protein [Nocardia sp. alder85J]